MIQRIQKIKSKLNAYALKLTGNEADANDLYQNAVMRMIRNQANYKVDNNFEGWATTVMRNIYLNDFRLRKRRKTFSFSAYPDFSVESNTPSVQNNGLAQLHYLELLKLVDQLPESLRKPFWMVYKGYKYEEIAEMLYQPIGTIKSSIFAARKRLKQLYRQNQATQSLDRRA